VVLEQAAHQFPGAIGELGMSPLAATRIGKSRHDLLEEVPGSVKRSGRAPRPLPCPDPACCAYADTGLLLICHVLVLDTRT
jgi:hypothetical protein